VLRASLEVRRGADERCQSLSTESCQKPKSFSRECRILVSILAKTNPLSHTTTNDTDIPPPVKSAFIFVYTSLLSFS
jgi:hypothetical protein